MITVNDYWRDEWLSSQTFQYSNVLLAYDEDYEWRLRCRHEEHEYLPAGDFIIDIARVESTSGEAIPVVVEAVIKDSVYDLHEALAHRGIWMAEKWFEDNL